MNFLRDFCRLSRKKMLLTLVLGLLPALLLRAGLFPARGPSDAISNALAPLAPLLHRLQDSAATAFLLTASGFIERALEGALAFLLLCALLLKDGSAPLSPLKAYRRHGLPYVAALAFLIALALLHYGSGTYAAGSMRLGNYSPGIGMLLYDAALLLFIVALCLPALRERTIRAHGPCAPLAVLVLAVYLSGALFRYTGLRFAPSEPFALLLGAAYTLAPLQCMLLYLFVCHWELWQKNNTTQ